MRIGPIVCGLLALVAGCTGKAPEVGKWVEANPSGVAVRHIQFTVDGRMFESTASGTSQLESQTWIYKRMDNGDLILRNSQGVNRRIRVSVFGENLSVTEGESAVLYVRE